MTSSFRDGNSPPKAPDNSQVHWPSGLVEHFDNLSIDAIHTPMEGSGMAVAATQKKS
jgi:hypothetical protein